jgi:hypothetical protein
MAMLQGRFSGVIVGILACGAGLTTATAQPLLTTQPTTASSVHSDEPSTSMLLAPEPFISDATGISFRPPAGCKNLGTNNGQLVANYSDDSRKWVLRVTEATFPNPVELKDTKDKDQHTVQGLLDYTVTQLKDAEPGCEILRNDIVNAGPYFVGMIALRYVQSGQTWLRQQALLEVNNQLYYIFNFVTPGAGGEQTDKEAVETFSSLIDTIKVLDRSQIKEDQNQRLYRTRSLFLYWNKQKFAGIIVPKQYFRILKNGKDIGYTYTEEMADRPDLAGLSNPGVIAFERTGLVESSADIVRQSAAEILEFMSYDRNVEQWTRSVLLRVTKAGKSDQTYATEFGNGFNRKKRVVSKEDGLPDPKDPHAPLSREVDVRHLDVSFTGQDQNPVPYAQDLPPFYLPQAGWHFLPRLVIDKAFPEARTYLFYVYDNVRREVVLLFVDVSEEQDVVFNGHQVHAIVVTEKMGLEANPVLYYVTPDGKYLGSEDRKNHLTTVASTADEVKKIWPDADFRPPAKMRSKDSSSAPGQ